MALVVYPSERYTTDEPPTLWDEVDDMARALYTTRDAAAMLNVGQNTLRDWALKAGIQRINDKTYDKRVMGWTLGELQHIADLHHRKLGKPPAEPEPSRRMRELTARVAALEAEVAELKARAAGVLPSRTRSEGQQPPAEDEGIQLIAQRQKRDTRPLVVSRSDTLPPGWIAIVDFCKRYGIPMRSITELYKPTDPAEEPKMPELKPHGPAYKRGNIVLTNVWDEVQQAAAFAHFQRAGRIPAGS